MYFTIFIKKEKQLCDFLIACSVIEWIEFFMNFKYFYKNKNSNASQYCLKCVHCDKVTFSIENVRKKSLATRTVFHRVNKQSHYIFLTSQLL